MYDENCRDPRQFSIHPSESGFTPLISDVRFWRMRISEMKIGRVRNGHQTYSYTPPPDRPLVTPKQYLSRYDQEGRLTRLVVCSYGIRLCHHRALVRNYVFSYSADDSALPEWEMMDRKLGDLVDSWCVP